MPLPIELQPIIRQNGGTLTNAQANGAGISNERLRLLVKAGELERAAFGVYVLPDEFIDRMYITQLRRPKITYSHETALFLHDLTDRDPISYTVTVPTGYNAAKLRDDGFTVFTVKQELHMAGATELTTMDMDATLKGQTLTAPEITHIFEEILRVPVDDNLTTTQPFNADTFRMALNKTIANRGTVEQMADAVLQ